MVTRLQYENCIYSIIKENISNVNNVTEFNTVLDVLTNENNDMQTRVNALRTFLTKFNVNIQKCSIRFNGELLTVLTDVFNKDLTVNVDLSSKTKLKLINYIKTTDVTDSLDTIIYELIEPSKDTDAKLFIELYNKMVSEKSIISILLFIFAANLFTLFKELESEEFDEFTIVTKVHNLLTDPSIDLFAFAYDHIEKYTDILHGTSEDFSNAMQEIGFQLSQQFSIDDAIISKFFILPFNKKSDSKTEPVPSNSKDVKSFLDSFSVDSNVDKIISKLTEELFTKWDSELVLKLNDVINNRNYITVFLTLLQLKDDVLLLKYILENLGVSDLLLTMYKEDKMYNLNTLYLSQYDKKTKVEDYINSLILKVSNDKEPNILSENDFNTVKNKLIEILKETVNNSKEIQNIGTLLNAQIKLDAQGKYTNTFRNILSAIFNRKNRQFLENAKEKIGGGRADNVFTGIFYDIIDNIKADSECKIKENVLELITGLSNIVNDNYSLDSINNLASNNELWEEAYTGYTVLNAIYTAMNSVRENNAYLICLYVTLIPNNFIKFNL